MDALERAIEEVGGVGKLADKLGIYQSTVSNWKTRKVPAERCADIERITVGKVTRADLRPDIFGPLPKKAKAA